MIQLISKAPSIVLDVGCGAGMTAMLIRNRFPNALTYGIETDHELCSQAMQNSERVFEGSIDDTKIRSHVKDAGPYDLIICADVLEHLLNPAETLNQLTNMLTQDGHIITSLPNVRHFSTFWHLGVRGTWPQHERGIFDDTHLHFYTRRNIVSLCQSAGLELIQEKRNMRILESGAWTMPAAKVFDFWPFRSFLTFQYLHLWIKRQRD